jgi:hypothetical protein
LDGTDFEIDLSADNQARLRDKLTRFVKNATPVRAPRARGRSGGRVSRPPASGPEQTQAIRAWAAANRYECPPVAASPARSRTRSPPPTDHPALVKFLPGFQRCDVLMVE